LGEEMEKPLPRVLRLGDLLDEWQKDATAAHEAYTTGKARGAITGLPKVDAELGGAFAPGLHVLHGAPGSGKTAWTLQTAGECGTPALYVSAEMGSLELLRRVTARTTGTFLGRLKSGELPPEESLGLVRRAVAAVPDLRIVDATRAYASPEWIRQQALPIVESGSRLLLVIDSLHSWSESAGDGLGEYELLNESLAALRRLAHSLDCPILVVCERNRASMKTGGMNAGAGSRRIEYGAESVLDLHRDEDAKPDAWGKVPVTLKFAKNRNGAGGREVKLSFHGAKQEFEQA
jgi:replicative DNA helicase